MAQLQSSYALISQSLWESLLDARIRFQKALAASNCLPVHAEFGSLVEKTSTHDAVHAMVDEALLLSEDFFQLQQARLFGFAPDFAAKSQVFH